MAVGNIIWACGYIFLAAIIPAKESKSELRWVTIISISFRYIGLYLFYVLIIADYFGKGFPLPVSTFHSRITQWSQGHYSYIVRNIKQIFYKFFLERSNPASTEPFFSCSQDQMLQG